jgi:hypothetical protein
MTSGRYARLVIKESLNVFMLVVSTSPVAVTIKLLAKKRWTEKKAR